MPWLTGDVPSGAAVCRAIFIPDEPAFTSAVLGALLELTYEYNWEQEGMGTPAEYAALAQEIIESYSDCDTGIGDMEFIAGVTLASPANYIELASIPGSYDSLVFMVVLRSDNASDFDGVNVNFNGDTGGNYRYGNSVLIHDTGALTPNAGNSQNSILIARLAAAADAVAYDFGAAKITMPNYANTTQNKIAIYEGANPVDANNANDQRSVFGVGYWNGPLIPVVSVRFTPNGGSNFIAGSKVLLYGVKGS